MRKLEKGGKLKGLMWAWSKRLLTFILLTALFIVCFIGLVLYSMVVIIEE